MSVICSVPGNLCFTFYISYFEDVCLLSVALVLVLLLASAVELNSRVPRAITWKGYQQMTGIPDNPKTR